MAGSVGVDVGGSGVRAAVVRDGDVGEVVRAPLDGRGVDAVVSAIARVVSALGPAAGVGVGVPGFVHGGVVLGSPNFPEWRDVDLGRRLEEALGLPVAVENDANCAALGVWASRGRREDLVVLTLGTGVGGGVVTEGRLLRGARGTGAELGHIYVGGDRPCGCGGVGCLERYVGTVGLLDGARARGRSVPDGEAVLDAARRGEPWAREVLDEAADALGRGLTTLVNVFAPDAVVLLGGLTAARDLLGPRAEGWLQRHGVRPSVAHARIVWGGRADELAILGAAARVGA